MPLSIDEATRRYEGYVENIQDSIFTIESLMGGVQSFQFIMPQSLANLHQVDVTKEEKDITTQIQVLEEYKKIISNEKKRRSMSELIESKQNFKDFKLQLKTKRRSDRVTKPYNKFKQAQPVINEEQ